MSNFAQDVRYALRSFAKTPGFTAVAVLTLALGIGACTSIFTVVNAVLLRPLPYPEPDRIAQLMEISDQGERMHVPQANFADWKSQSSSFQQMAAYSGSSLATILGGREPVLAETCVVSEGFFEVLGVAPQRGRGFLADEHRAGGAPVAMVSQGFWQRALDGNPDLDNTTLRYGPLTFSVVGVMPAGFSYPPGTEIWIPMEPFNPPNPSRSAHNWRVIGRLKPDVTAAQATAELSGIAKRIHQQYSDVTAVDAAVVLLHARMTAGARPALLLLLGVVGVLLLIACCNVANLLLAQVTSRRREIAVRAALGAGRRRLVSQFLTESLVLALAGAAAGTVLASWGVDAMVALGGGQIPRVGEMQIDGRVLAFTVGVSLLAAVILSVVPALRLTGANLQDLLRGGGRSSTASSSQRAMRHALVVAQVGLTVVLLVGAGLLGRSFWQALQVDLGFTAGNQLTLDLLLPQPDTPEQVQRVARVHEGVLQRILALPGVTAAGGVSDLPLSGRSSNGRFRMDGGKTSGDYWPNYRVASPGYFAVMGIPLLDGRVFDSTDGPHTSHVAVISRNVAERAWPGENPIGKRIQFGNMDGYQDWITIVGVVGDVRHHGPEFGTRGDIYLHYQQRPRRTATFSTVIHAAGDPRALIPAIRQIVQELDPELPASFRTLDSYFASVLSDRTFNLALVGVFGGTALLLAVMGIYGVMSYSVVQRTQEIGIRMALGAMGGNVIRQFLREGGKLVLLGVALGLAGAAALSKYVASLLYNTSAYDPLTFAAVAAAMSLVALLACWIPARRATRVDPMVALRHE